MNIAYYQEMRKRRLSSKNGFTIAELIVVIVVIGILASVTIVGYGSWKSSTLSAAVKSDLNGAVSAMENYRNFNDGYPSSIPTTFTPSNGVTLTVYGPSNTAGYCIDGVSNENPSITYYVSSAKKDQGAIAGTCSGILSSPSTPANLNAVTFGVTQVNVSWDSVAGATSYIVEGASDSGFIYNSKKITVGLNSGTLTGLVLDTQYYVRVKAVNSTGDSPWTSAYQVAKASALDTPVCSAVADSTSQITVSWGAISGSGTVSYSLEYDDTNTFASLSGSYSGTALTYAATNLNYGATYYFRVKAVDGSGSSLWSSTCQTSTLVLSAPSITVTVNSTSQITVSWGAIPGASSYDVQADDNSSFTSPASLNTAGTSQAFTSLYPGTTYSFRARTVGSNGITGWSGTVPGTTANPTLSGPVECAGTYSGRSAYQLRLYLDEVSYNIPANSSNVNWQLYRIQVSTWSGSWDQTTTWPWAVSINGSNWSGSSNSIAFKTVHNIGSTEVIASSSLTVAHTANGTKTITYSGSDGPGSGIFGSASCSGSYVLSDLR